MSPWYLGDTVSQDIAENERKKKEMGIYRKDSGPYKEPDAPYAGFVQGKPAVAGCHVLVSGVTGSGKSRRVLGPGILTWKGPVVAVSSKPDLIDLCLTERLSRPGAHGHTYIIDLSGEVPDEVIPEGVQKMAIDPTALIHNSDDALDMSTIMLQTGSAGASGNGGKGGDDFWQTLATAPLAAILKAAGDDGILWALQAVSLHEIPEGEDEHVPSWPEALERLQLQGEDMLASKLLSVATKDAKMRDSVAITMESALSPWLRSTVAPQGLPAFTPSMLESPRATLFMVAPADGVAAGAAVGLTDCITKRWRKNQTEPQRLPRLLLTIDELTNTMPWAKLPVVVTESRAMGINLLVAVQGTSQLAKRYGDSGMKEIRDTFPSTLILTAAPEKEMLEAAAWWIEPTERAKMSVDHQGNQSISYERDQGIEHQAWLPRDITQGRLLRGKSASDTATGVHAAGVMVDLPDISQLAFR